jgi:hypothetical protein
MPSPNFIADRSLPAGASGARAVAKPEAPSVGPLVVTMRVSGGRSTEPAVDAVVLPGLDGETSTGPGASKGKGDARRTPAPSPGACVPRPSDPTDWLTKSCASVLGGVRRGTVADPAPTRASGSEGDAGTVVCCSAVGMPPGTTSSPLPAGSLVSSPSGSCCPGLVGADEVGGNGSGPLVTDVVVGATVVGVVVEGTTTVVGGNGMNTLVLGGSVVELEAPVVLGSPRWVVVVQSVLELAGFPIAVVLEAPGSDPVIDVVDSVPMGSTSNSADALNGEIKRRRASTIAATETRRRRRATRPIRSPAICGS